MFGLLGPNGAGKTSSIRMMVGITMPDSGVVSLFGRPFTRESLKKVGYLPEERGLYRKMKVMDQLIFMGQLHGLPADLVQVPGPAVDHHCRAHAHAPTCDGVPFPATDDSAAMFAQVSSEPGDGLPGPAGVRGVVA